MPFLEGRISAKAAVEGDSLLRPQYGGLRPLAVQSYRTAGMSPIKQALGYLKKSGRSL